MTMPSKMPEYPVKRRITWIDDDTNEQVGQCEYIRADIAEELARALEHMVLQFQHPDQMADDALVKYRAITP